MISAGASAVPGDANWASRHLPLDDLQTCGFCGSWEWAWVYPLRVQARAAFTLGEFWCACVECHRLVENGDDAGLHLRHGPDDEHDPHSFAEDVLPTFHVVRDGAPLTRTEAQRA